MSSYHLALGVKVVPSIFSLSFLRASCTIHYIFTLCSLYLRIPHSTDALRNLQKYEPCNYNVCNSSTATDVSIIITIINIILVIVIMIMVIQTTQLHFHNGLGVIEMPIVIIIFTTQLCFCSSLGATVMSNVITIIITIMT